MQAYLHFSSAHSNSQITDFMAEASARANGQDFITLSHSEALGAAGYCQTAEAIALSDLRAEAALIGVDVNLLPQAPYLRKLMLCDMDSTIITGESLDDLSAMAGIGEAVAAITARAMAGELDFKQALAERLGMLKDEPVALLERLIQETQAFDGAAELVATMRAHDATCLLVSGGFTFLTSDIAQRFGFSDHFANELAIEDGKIAGHADEPIIDSSAKLRILNEFCDRLSITHNEVMSMGDGANDIPMLEAASLGIAWQAKPLVKERIALQLSHSNLCGPLFLQGVHEKDIVSA